MVLPDVTWGEAPAQGRGQEWLRSSQLCKFHSHSQAFGNLTHLPSQSLATSSRKPALISLAEAVWFSPLPYPLDHYRI